MLDENNDDNRLTAATLDSYEDPDPSPIPCFYCWGVKGRSCSSCNGKGWVHPDTYRGKERRKKTGKWEIVNPEPFTIDNLELGEIDYSYLLLHFEDIGKLSIKPVKNKDGSPVTGIHPYPDYVGFRKLLLFFNELAELDNEEVNKLMEQEGIVFEKRDEK